MPKPDRTVASGVRWGLIGVLGGTLTIVGLLIGGMVLVPRYRAAHPASALQRSDADRVAVDDLYLDVTLVTPAFRGSRQLERYFGGRDPESVLPLLVGLNTHKGSIEHMHHMEGQIFLVDLEGSRYPALTEPIVLTQHHNAYMFLFPPRDNLGRPFLDAQRGSITVEAVGVGAVPVRRFHWDLPLEDERGPVAGGGFVATLMLVAALAGALLVVLSPCALELSLYYTAIISWTVGEGEKGVLETGDLEAAVRGRRRVMLNLTSFVAGFTLLYATAGATVGLIGEGVRQPLGEYSELIQIAGGSLILFFALRVLGLDRLLLKPLQRLAGPRLTEGTRAVQRRLTAWPRGLLGRLRFRGQSGAAAAGTMRARDSFLVGMGLSSACLGCMGGAVLYPLLVYAGMTSWYSGLVTLGLYSLAIALPMAAIAMGFFRLRLSLVRRLSFNRGLRYASGFLLGGIGMLIVTGQERLITDVAFGFLAAVSRWIG